MQRPCPGGLVPVGTGVAAPTAGAAGWRCAFRSPPPLGPLGDTNGRRGRPKKNPSPAWSTSRPRQSLISACGCGALSIRLRLFWLHASQTVPSTDSAPQREKASRPPPHDAPAEAPPAGGACRAAPTTRAAAPPTATPKMAPLGHPRRRPPPGWQPAGSASRRTGPVAHTTPVPSPCPRAGARQPRAAQQCPRRRAHHRVHSTPPRRRRGRGRRGAPGPPRPLRPPRGGGSHTGRKAHRRARCQ